jgi:hypothetical protein
MAQVAVAAAVAVAVTVALAQNKEWVPRYRFLAGGASGSVIGVRLDVVATWLDSASTHCHVAAIVLVRQTASRNICLQEGTGHVPGPRHVL